MGVKKFILLAVCLYCVSGAADKKDNFGNEHFLKNSVEVPRIHEGSADIHEISDAKTQDPAHDKRELDELLKPIFERFVVNKQQSREVGRHNNVKFGSDGKAYKTHKYIPNQEKKRTNGGGDRFVIDENGNARRPKGPLIPSMVERKKDEGEGKELSMKEITNSVEKLIAKLTHEKVQEEKKEDGEEFKFQSVGDKESTSESDDTAFQDFRDKFLKTFIKKDSTEEKRQLLVNTGKDTSKKDEKVAKRTARLNNLYDELRKETTARMEEKRQAEAQEKNKRERLEIVKKDLVDLMNGLQSREEFEYKDHKFQLADATDSGPGLVNTGKDHNSPPPTVEKKEESRLETVELLVKELRELEREEKKKREEKKSAKKMGKMFLDVFQKELEKKKKSRENEQDKKEDLAEKTKTDIKRKDSNTREMLVELMGELEKRIVKDRSKIAEDDKQINKLEKKREEQKKEVKNIKISLEDELDSILTDLSADRLKKRNSKNSVGTTKNWGVDEETDKALQGFNVDDEALAKKSRP